MTAPARLSVVTVAWQTGPRLLEAVASILAAPGVDEFVLVNHGNPPELIRALRAMACLLYTSPSPRDRQKTRMPSSA